MPSIWFAPWEVHEGGYRAPGGGNIGMLDLRRYDQLGYQDQEGYGFFVYPHRRKVPNGRYLGRDPQGYLSRSDRNFMEAALGVAPQETQIRRALRELYLAHADPAGVDRWGPLGIDRWNGFDLPLGGFGWLYRERFSPDHPAFPVTLARHRAAYRQHYADGVPVPVLRRWTGAQMLDLFGYLHDELLEALLPPECLKQGWDFPDTEVSDDFFREDQVLSDGNWQVVQGTWRVVNHEVECTGDGTGAMARYATALSSANHYSEITFTSANRAAANMRPEVRMAASAHSGYAGFTRELNSGRGIQLTANGVFTTLVGDNDGGGPVAVVRTTANGNNITLRIAGQDVFTVADSTLPSNLHVGLSGHPSTASISRGQNFKGADLVSAQTTVTLPGAASPLSASPMRQTMPRGRAVGVQDIIVSGAAAGELLKADGEGAMALEDDSAVINFIIDGGGAAIETGLKGHVEIPFGLVITGWSIIADQSGSIVVDVWRGTDYSDIPTDADSIAGTELPTLSSQQSNQDLSLTSWTTTIAAGNILAFNVDSATTVERVTVVLRGRKT